MRKEGQITESAPPSNPQRNDHGCFAISRAKNDHPGRNSEFRPYQLMPGFYPKIGLKRETFAFLFETTPILLGSF